MTTGKGREGSTGYCSIPDERSLRDAAVVMATETLDYQGKSYTEQDVMTLASSYIDEAAKSNTMEGKLMLARLMSYAMTGTEED